MGTFLATRTFPVPQPVPPGESPRTPRIFVGLGDGNVYSYRWVVVVGEFVWGSLFTDVVVASAPQAGLSLVRLSLATSALEVVVPHDNFPKESLNGN